MFVCEDFDYVFRYLEAEKVGAIVHEQEKILVAPPPMSLQALGTSPPLPLDPLVGNVTTPPAATFPLLTSTNESSIGSEPTLSPPAQNQSRNNSALVALGVGIGIGGAVVLVFVAAFVVWYKRRKRRRRAFSEPIAPLGLKS
ncbi:hypothetical protein L1887_08679 [Cichorium endivia]|nr:hypothetical protein L1887_08679 [Cichorium endivia]